jgi:hypothetical protein
MILPEMKRVGFFGVLMVGLALAGCNSSPGSSGTTGGSGSSTGGASGSTSGGSSGTASSSTSTGGGSSTTGGSSSTTGGGSGTTGGSSSTTGGSTGGPIVRSFDGDFGPGLTVCQGMTIGHCDRPEMNAAANGTQVAQVTPQHLNVYDYNGSLLQSTSLATVITAAGLANGAKGDIEPSIVFDEFIGRWIITATCAQDCLLVSADSDPRNAWSGIYIGGLQADPSIRLSYDKNGVYLSEFHMGSDPNTGSCAAMYWAIPGAELAWTGTLSVTHSNGTANLPYDGIPVTDPNPNKTSTDPAYFVTRTCPNTGACAGACQNATQFSFNWILTSVTWSGTTATFSADQVIKTDIGSAQNKWIYNVPKTPTAQAGTSVGIRATESHRILGAVQNGTHIYTVLNSGPCTGSSCGAQGADSRNLFFWVDLDCTNPTACTVAQTGKVSDPNNDLVFGTIGAASSGNLAIVAATSGPGIEPSILAWTHKATDAASALNGPVTVMSGTQPDTCINDPVSFANAVAVTVLRDPLDPTAMWASHQYSNSASPCVWATRIIQLVP